MMHTCIILTTVSGLALAYFFYHNKNRQMERHYYKNNKLAYALLMFTCFLLAAAFVLNSRHLSSEFLKMFMMNFKVVRDLYKWKDELVARASRA